MKKIKDSIAAILYRFILIIVKLLPTSKGKNHLLIIKVDEIGDYMLFRGALKYFKQSDKYKNHRITLVGNVAWKAIFDEYDSDTVNNSIWITKKKFNRDLYYRFSLLKQIRFLKTSDVINCIFSRSIILDDGIAFVANAEHKVAMKPDEHNSNMSRYAIRLDNVIYNELVDAGDEKVFELIRNSHYISQALCSRVSLTIKLNVHDKKNYEYENYFVIFIGPGNKIERKWPVANFVQCAEYIYRQYGYSPVICGGPTDEEAAAEFISLYQGKAVNLAGKTTLPGFIELLSKAKFLLSVDNGPVHMASAAGCPVVGLYSGVHYGRYAPYPKEVAEFFYSIYPDSVDELVEKKSDDVYDPFKMKNEAIRTIEVGKVEKNVDTLLSSLN